MIDIGQKRVRSLNYLILLVFERPFVTGPPSFEVAVVSCKIFCRHNFYLLQHQNCLATSNHATLGFYFSLGVLGSLVTDSDSQISEVIALNPSFTMFSIKINVRDLNLREFSFVYV